jgi:hypothetical protein
LNPAGESFFRLIRNPLKFRFFLLKNLPSAYFSGVRLVSVNEAACEVKVPYKWFSRNPFKSTYFACLAMAAEMSTGVLAMAHIYKRKPPVSMLVTGLEAEYHKKATGRTFFTCNDGKALEATILAAIETGEGKSFTAISTGKNEAGELVAIFKITWSFRVKSNKT